MVTEGQMPDTVASAAQALRNGELSPVELLEYYLDRIARLNPQLNAFVTIDSAGAMRAAKESAQRFREGKPKGPLDGIPIGLKDLFYLKGVRTTAGSKIFSDFVPDDDATVVAALKEAGAVIVGMTNTHEFALGTTTENPHHGPTRNPWDIGRVPGGSSGGSGAAVAACLVLAATGTDTGGSIRIPAALCGAVGLKPTFGLVSRWGVFPLSWSLDHPGPIARTVEDAALMLEVMAGYDPNDPTTAGAPAVSYREAVGQGMEGVRVGVPGRFFFERIEPGVEAAVRAAIARLEECGARLVEVDWPDADDAVRVVGISSLIMSAEAAAFHSPYLKSRADDYGEDVYQRMDWGRHILACEYLNAQRWRTVLIRNLGRVFQEVDVVATPTCPVTAFPIGTRQVVLGGEPEPAGASLVRFTRMANLTGWPAISVPCGVDERQLPVGIQFMAGPYNEPLLIRVAHAFEQARGPMPSPQLAC